MISTEIGLLGVSTKWKALSAASGSEPALTVPRTVGSASVNGANEMDADAFGADARVDRLDRASFDLQR